MPNSMLTGVSGLIAHQRLLDNVGNNIANINTHGFKATRVLFADLLYETLRPASGPSGSGSGGTNPVQVGGGVKVVATDRSFTQGALELTGDEYDLALSGDGFFVVNDGESDLYTRAGAFTLDDDQVLVTPGGLPVQRFSNAGEGDATSPAFQVPGDSRIRVPIRASLEGVTSTEVLLTGNLDGNALPAAAEVQQSDSPFTVAGGAPATGATLLNDLEGASVPFVAGDFVTISGRLSNNDPYNVNVAVDGASTLQDLADAVDGIFTDASVAIVDGRIVVTADQTGPSNMTVQFSLPDGNTGQMSFEPHQIKETVMGKDAATEAEVVQIFDEQGGAHEVKLLFQKQSDNVWNLTASMDPSEGVLTDATVENITFNDMGELQSTTDPFITLQINGISTPQTISLAFSDNSGLNRLTQLRSKPNVDAKSDGAAPGALTKVRIEKDGRVTGISSTGQEYVLAQLALANFSNPNGLTAIADNLYRQSLNSGQPDIGLGGTGGRGDVVGGTLEASNVDVAIEFTRLIVAQRGFSANARTVTVSSQVLEELTNIIR